ncbi:tetratricopeptide repeat protein [Streptomyces sp. A7024]|uniref:Tetratricopeptide repeat protein n=1 Tax=Streptomyces coryli TaxID=1128680 RepID=A0A6G4TXM8_9ACTN|nr:tetratricopeptide repeat protein [Streptomyces coryli]NGN63868.1 tetratricopeptide repeat protein [Streptomyces coryli]
MAVPQDRVTRKDFIRRRRQGGFVGRATELALFRENLSRPPERNDNFELLFHVAGAAGSGKTSLLHEWEKIAREVNAVTAFVGDEAHDAVDTMEGIASQLSRQACPLKNFEKALREYKQRRVEAEAVATIPSSTATEASPSSLVASQLLLTGLGSVPGVGAIVGAVDPGQVALGADRMRSAVSGRFSKANELDASPISTLTQLFTKDLCAAAERHPWIVLFLDSFETTHKSLGSWIQDLLFNERYEELPLNVVVALGGQQELDAGQWNDWRDQVCQVELDVFTESEARSLLAARGVTDEATIIEVFRLSDRLPVLVSTLAQSAVTNPEVLPDPAETAVERFLGSEMDEVNRETVLTCAYPLYLNEDIFQGLGLDVGGDVYPWICSLPFVSDQAGRRRYHEIVRSPMLRLQRQESPTRWRSRHRQLADMFNSWQEQLQQDRELDDVVAWAIPEWRDWHLSYLYHSLCENPRGLATVVPQEGFAACLHGEGPIYQWLQTLHQAGIDSGDAQLQDWSRRLEGAASADGEISLSVLETLSKMRELSDTDRSVALWLRGQILCRENRYDEALHELNKSVEITEDFLPAILVRALILLSLGKVQPALLDLDRVIDADPTGELMPLARVTSLAARGTFPTYSSVEEESASWDSDAPMNILARAEYLATSGRPRESLAELDRMPAELDELTSLTLVQRARALAMLSRNDEALSCVDEALEIWPDFTPLLTQRSEILSAVGRVPEALEDIQRAMELNPNLPGTIISYCRILITMGRSADAFSKVDGLLQSSPNLALGLIIRSALHLEFGRRREALADAEAAQEISPDDIRGHISLAEALMANGRFAGALAEIEVALGADLVYPIALCVRARIFLAMGEAEKAAEDANKALSGDKELALALVIRSITAVILGRDLRQALDDVNLALEKNPHLVMAHATRAQVLSAMGRQFDAVRYLSTFLKMSPDSLLVVVARSSIYASLGRTKEALEDLNRSLSINPNFEPALIDRSELLLSSGRPAEALRDLEKLVQMGSILDVTDRIEGARAMQVVGRAGVGELSGTSGSHSAGRDLQALELAIAENPHDFASREERVEALLRADRIDEAMFDITEVVEQTPDRVSARLLRAEINLALGNADIALDDLNQALQCDPDDIQVLANRGCVLEILGDAEAAMSDLNRAVEIAPHDEWVKGVWSHLMESSSNEER